MKFKKVKDGEWQQPVRKGYKLMCCDCGLVHTIDFRIIKSKIQFRAYRNERSTWLARRGYSGIRFRRKGKIIGKRKIIK